MNTEPEDSVLFPDYYAIVERNNVKGWGLWPSRKFYPVVEFSSTKTPTERFQIKCLEHGLNWKQVLAEIRRHHCGKIGFYLVNLRDREYHYCGTELRDIKTFVKEKGIGF